MKRSVVGIIAHVDAGKTTLSEAMLYCSGNLRTLGRVDHKDAFLDNFALERQRGITIFSKQAVLPLSDIQITLLDTPGHVDFSSETERTLDVLDCAVLVISAPAGIQSHTRTLWKLLQQRNIPTFLFINKMDLPGADKAAILAALHKELGGDFIDFSDLDMEAASMCDELLLEEYLETGCLSPDSLSLAISRHSLFPCWFGAALRLSGVDSFLQGLSTYAPSTKGRDEFSAKIFKISRDEQGTRLTHMKITGGILHVRDMVSGDGWLEKVTQLRLCSGAKFQPVSEAYPGDIVAVSGLSHTSAGKGLGGESDCPLPSLEPVLAYRVILPQGCDVHRALDQFRQLEEEEPQLHVDWDSRLQQLSVRLMGPVQLEILRQLLIDRFGLDAEFSQGSIIYRETISAPVEGVGHYEPLRHYAEVHLLMEPGERGSGLVFASSCSEDALDRNWQRLILTHLAEKQHLGVLTGAPITDMKITLASGKAHLKHTEGGDFRQATYRAVRQGLMQAQSVLLEPWYDFRLELPHTNVGKALSDLQMMNADFDSPDIDGSASVITGSGPVSALQNYARDVIAYTHGLGKFSCSIKGYFPCRDQDSAVEAIGYDAEADVENSADSVFCRNGAGTSVKWSEVPDHMHLPSILKPRREESAVQQRRAAGYLSRLASDKELMVIFERTYGPINRDRSRAMRPASRPAEVKPYKAAPPPSDPEYLLVDGYNIIFAWDSLRELAEDNLDLARARLIDILRNYQGYLQTPVIVVFDAYKVKNNPGSVETFGGLSVIYTKEAETADMYIEKTTHQLAKKHRVRVATSDGLEQMIILGSGALRVPASAFQEEVRTAEEYIRQYISKEWT